MAKHLIHKQRYEIEIENRLQAHPISNRLSTLNQQKLSKIIAHILDRFDLPGQYFRFEKLEIDLGYLSEGDLEKEIIRKLPKALINALLKELNRIDHLVPSLKKYLKKRLTELSSINPSSPSFYAPYSLPDFTKEDYFTLKEASQIQGKIPAFVQQSHWRDKPLKEIPLEQLPPDLLEELRLLHLRKASNKEQKIPEFSFSETVMDLNTSEAIDAITISYFLETGRLPNWWTTEEDPQEKLLTQFRAMDLLTKQSLLENLIDEPKMVYRLLQQFPMKEIISWIEPVAVDLKVRLYQQRQRVNLVTQGNIMKLLANDLSTILQEIEKSETSSASPIGKAKGLAQDPSSGSNENIDKTDAPVEGTNIVSTDKTRTSSENKAQSGESNPETQKQETAKTGTEGAEPQKDEIDELLKDESDQQPPEDSETNKESKDVMTAEELQESAMIQSVFNLVFFIAERQVMPWWWKIEAGFSLEKTIEIWVQKILSKTKVHQQLVSQLDEQVLKITSDAARKNYLKNWFQLWPENYRKAWLDWVLKTPTSTTFTVSETSPENQIVEQIISAIESRNKDKQVLVKDPAETTSAEDPLLKKLEGKWTVIELIRYFLRYGSLPPGVRFSQIEIESLILEESKQRHKEIQNLFRSLSAQNLPPSSGLGLLSDRLVYQLFKGFMPGRSTELSQWHQTFNKSKNLPENERFLLRFVKPHLIAYATTVNSAQVKPVHYLSHFIKYLNRNRSLAPQLGAHMLKEILESSTDKSMVQQELLASVKIIQGRIEKAQPKSKQAPVPTETEVTRYPWKPRPKIGIGEPVFVKNAGLILLWPFFPMYFERLKMITPDRKFKDTATASRAVHLLQYLTTKQTAHPEFELILNKLLCGFPLEDPVDFDIELSQEEIDLSESLLNGVIGHWKMLGNTTTDGLRGAFLIRDGKLTKQEGNKWTLKVEERPFDMLIDKVPWGMGMVKLSWMPQIITVEWR